MPSFNGKEVVALGVYRTWNLTPEEALESGGMYGRMSTMGQSHGGVLDWIVAMEAVMVCYGAPEEFQIAFQTSDTKWHDYTTAGFDDGPD